MSWKRCMTICLFLAFAVAEDDDAAEGDTVAAGSDQPEFSFGMVVNETVVKEDDDEEFKSEVIKLKNIAIFIRSQHNSFHKNNAEMLKTNLLDQASKLENSGKLEVVCSHDKEFPFRAWTINPIVKMLKKRFSKKKWIFFCEDTTQINLEKLLLVLGKYDSSQELFLAHGLVDSIPAIIHHYYHEDMSFQFPDFDAGWALSMPMIGLYIEKLSVKTKGTQFTIDVKHEVAMLLYDGGKGYRLTDVPEFCVSKDLQTNDCATTCHGNTPECKVVPVDKVFVAVKTCHLFHDDRVPVILNTVSKQTKHIVLYSDRENASIPTVHVGVVNTERGHCLKLYTIIRKFHGDRDHADKAWLVVIDDDSIMNLDRLRHLLGCYNPDDKILLGERYGFGLSHETTYGYDYITGGGGMIMSRGGVAAMVKNGCKCPRSDTPDDMWLGSCFAGMGVPTVHTSSLHQSHPATYSKDLLSHQYLVSFHKHTYMDPMTVYNDYLKD